MRGSPLATPQWVMIDRFGGDGGGSFWELEHFRQLAPSSTSSLHCSQKQLHPTQTWTHKHTVMRTHTHAHIQKLFTTSGCQGNMGHCSLSYVLTSERREDRGREEEERWEKQKNRWVQEAVEVEGSSGMSSVTWGQDCFIFSLTMVRWQFRPNSTVAFQVILLKLYNVPFYYTWVSLEKIIVQCEQHWNALIMSYRTFHKCLTCLLTFSFSIKLQRVH